MDIVEIRKVLENCEFFRGLEAGHIKQVADLCRVETCEAGRHVFHQGDFGDNIYIIVEGSVYLERERDLGSRKGVAVIGLLGKGRVLGCWSTLLGEPHHLMSSACCRKETTLLTIKGSDLRDMMVSDTKLGFNLLERLCFLLRDRIEGAYGAMEKI